MADKSQSRTDKRPKKKSGKKKITPLKHGILQPRFVPPAATLGLEGRPHPSPPYGPVTAPQLVSAPTARAEVSARRRRYAWRSGGLGLFALLMVFFFVMWFGATYVRPLDPDNPVKRAYCLAAELANFSGKSDRFLTMADCPI